MKRLIPFVIAACVGMASCTTQPETVTASIPGPIRTIPAEIQKPSFRKGGKAPMVIICHGLTGNMGETHLTMLADSLQARGIASIRFNFNGHGDDTDNFSKHTISKEVTEAVAVYEYVASLDWVDAGRIAIAGHSQGGAVAGLTAAELGADKVKCLGLMAPGACIHEMVLSGDFLGVKFPDLDFAALKAAAEADPEAPQGAPFWDGRVLGWDYVIDAAQLDIHALTARYTGPTAIIQGSKDDPGIYKGAKEYLDYMPGIEYYELEGLTHCYPEDYPLAAHTTAAFLAKYLE